LDQKSNPQRPTYEKAFANFVGQTPDSWDATHGQADNILYMLVLSLFVQGGQQWQANRLSFLKRLISFVGIEFRTTKAREDVASPATPPTPSSPTPSSPSSSVSADDFFKTFRPLLVFFTFIDQIQSILKPPQKPTTTTSTGASPVSPSSSEWVAHVITQAKTNPVKLQNDFRDLLSTYEDEFIAFENFMEFADYLGLLPAIMTETPDCNEFLLRYIQPQNAQ